MIKLHLSNLQFIIIYLFSAVFLGFNLFYDFGWPAMFVYGTLTLMSSYILGKVFNKQSPVFGNLFIGFLLYLSQIIILGSLVYYAINLKTFSIFFVFWTITLLNLFLFFKYKTQLLCLKLNWKKFNLQKHFGFILFILFACWNLAIILQTGTLKTLNSPWEILGSEFWLTYLATAFCLIFYLNSKKTLFSKTLILIIFFLLSSIIALGVYRVGYGFDPFIHEATQKYIVKKGSITPKPFYYIGQYSLVVIVSRLSSVPLEVLSRLLVPLLFAFIPLLFTGICSGSTFIGILSLLLLPFIYFIVTTPFNFASLWLIFVIITLWRNTLSPQKQHKLIALIFALTSFIIHPLAGEPAMFIAIASLFWNVKKRAIKWLKTIYVLLFAGAVPATFILRSVLSGNWRQTANLDGWKNLGQILQSQIPSIKFTSTFNLLYDTIYFWGQNLLILYLMIVLAVIFWLKLHKKLKKYDIFVLGFGVFFLNGVLLNTFILFPKIISYEQSDFSHRIIKLSFYFLFPLSALGLNLFFKKTTNNKVLKIFFSILLSCLLGIACFFSYPRNNRYETGHGYSVSISDIKAVQKINQNAQNKDYFVLANQMVGAAALKEFGFVKYYPQKQPPSNKEHFYYSIPTGDLLYQKYLKMVYDFPNRTTMSETAKIINVNKGYFVINRYWTDFEKIIQNAQSQADHFYIIDNGNIYIFEFDNLLNSHSRD